MEVRRKGDWENWIKFFLRGVATVSDEATESAKKLKSYMLGFDELNVINPNTDSGIEDIFIAYPLVGKMKTTRAMALAQRVRRLILAVDSIPQAEGLNEAAKAAGIVVEVRMEVDTGCRRTGVSKENRVALAKRIRELTNLNMTGIYTFKSLILKVIAIPFLNNPCFWE